MEVEEGGGGGRWRWRKVEEEGGPAVAFLIELLKVNSNSFWVISSVGILLILMHKSRTREWLDIKTIQCSF